MELYWASGSLDCWRVMLALLFKNLDYEATHLSIPDREHQGLAYTSLNPRGTLPTLVVDDTVVTEANAILATLDRYRPAHPLFGDTPAEAGRLWRKLLEFDRFVMTPALPIVRGLTFGTWKPVKGELRERVGELLVELDRLETHCERGSYNAIDCAVVPLIAVLKRVSMKNGAEEVGLLPLDWSRWSRLHDRYDAIRALDGFEATWPQHWA